MRQFISDEKTRKKCADLLANPKAKTARLERKLALARRGKMFTPDDKLKPVPVESRMARVFTGLSRLQLERRKHQFARRASTAKHTLAKMSPSSPFRAMIARTQDINLKLLLLVNAEAKRRDVKVS